MMVKKIMIVGGAILALMAGALVTVSIMVASVLGTSICVDDSGATSSVKVVIDGDSIRVDGEPLTAEQLDIAREIIGQGRDRGLSDKDIVTAVTVGYQESGLRNLNYGHLDSLGVFQQRPSQGWGTPAQILHVPYAVGRFYDELERVQNRAQKTELEIALEVQKPDARAYRGEPPYSPDHRFVYWIPLGEALVASATDAPITKVATTTTIACDIEDQPGPVPGIGGDYGVVGTCPSGTPSGTAKIPSGQEIQLCSIEGVTVEANFGAYLQVLFNAARRDGIDLGGWGYRDNSVQIQLRMQHCGTSYYAIYEMPAHQCTPNTAIPGTSNHEFGVAWDGTSQFGSINYGDPAHNWLRKNATNVFKEHPTEPWHWTLISNPRH